MFTQQAYLEFLDLGMVPVNINLQIYMKQNGDIEFHCNIPTTYKRSTNGPSSWNRCFAIRQ